MSEITTLLYWISTALLIPVILLLLYFFGKALILTGRFIGLFSQQRKEHLTRTNFFKNLNSDNISEQLEALPSSAARGYETSLVELHQCPNTEAHWNRFLNEQEIVAQKELGKSQSLAKLGPILGLMGTLIPMGPALVGLASGDIASMASNMQVAFATTVVGLLIGAVGFVITQIRKRWLATELNNLEFVVELLQQKKTV